MKGTLWAHTIRTSTTHITRLLAESKGFTLIEIMVVIIILGLLATLVIPNITGYTEKAKREKARADIASLEGALELFKADNGFYPTTEQGLDALIVKPVDRSCSGEVDGRWLLQERGSPRPVGQSLCVFRARASWGRL